MKFVVINNSTKFPVKRGTLLIKILQQKNIPIMALCGGNGRCGKCRVKVEGNIAPPDRIDRLFIPRRFLKEGYRLACRYRIEEDIKIQLPLIKKRKKTGILNAGFALDLGTTLIKGAKVDISDGRVIDQAKVQNLQNSFGGDVISRVSATLGGNYKKLRKQMMLSIGRIKEQLGIREPALTVIVGNPVMLSFYLSKPVSGFGSYPFRSKLKGLITKKNPVRLILPIIGGFVGSDTVAGIIASQIYARKKNYLYIDLGTNGEVALIIDDRIIVTSTAAGPAFEGVGLSCGIPAVEGAIEQINYKKGFCIKTINNKKAIGICASGIIDLLAILLELKWLRPDGRLLKKPRFEHITIEQADIRKLQLAIGAIHTGIRTLLDRARIRSDEIDAAILTGEFGSHLTISSLFKIGLLPQGIKRVYCRKDLPLKGAILAIKDNQTIEQARRISRSSEHIELALEPDFQKLFVQSMRLMPWR